MSYVYYIRSNKEIKYASKRKLGKDGIMPENTELSIETFLDANSKYEYNYYLYISEFELFFKNQQKDRLSQQINNLIKNNWKIKSEIVIEIIWEGKMSSKPRKIKLDIDYRLLNESLIKSFFTLKNIDFGTLRITSP